VSSALTTLAEVSHDTPDAVLASSTVAIVVSAADRP
jgi:hypothetical protein